jgi:outer membrane protein TolC
VQAVENVNQARNSWMNNLNLFTSFNSYNNPQSQNFAIVPNLGLGLSLNVGSVYSLFGKVKIAKEDLKISENEENAQRLYIRSEVIARYNGMRLNLELLKFQTEATEEMRMTVAAVKEKFNKGEISIEEYNKAYVAFTVAMERAITSESNYRTAKAYLEELLSIHLEQIL